MIAELALVAFITVLVMMVEVAKLNPEHAPAQKLSEGLLAIIGLSLLAYSLTKLLVDWSDADWALLAMSFATPIWLTVGALLPVAALATYSGYETMFIRTSHHAQEGFGLRKRLGVIAALRLRPSVVGALNGPAHVRLAHEATGLRSAYRLARKLLDASDLPPPPKPWTYDRDDHEWDPTDPHDYFLLVDDDALKLDGAINAAQDGDPLGRERLDELAERMRARHDRQRATTGFTSKATHELIEFAEDASKDAERGDVRAMALKRRRLHDLRAALITELVERGREE